MAVCNFCGRKFGSKQAVRAHLRACDEYEPKTPQPIGSAKPNAQARGTDPRDFDPVAPVRNQVLVEKEKLSLRQIQAAHKSLDLEDSERARREQHEREASRQREWTRELAHERAKEEARERREQEALAQTFRKERRKIIQQIKEAAIQRWRPPFGYSALPTELEVEASQEIEHELLALPVDELPKEELVRIAEGTRDRIYRPWLEAQQESRQLEGNRRTLIKYGNEYARQETEGVLIFDQQEVLKKIGQDLEDEITGEETRAEIREFVDDILEDELEWKED